MATIVINGKEIVITEVHESSVELSWKEYFERNTQVMHLINSDFRKRITDDIKEESRKPSPYRENSI